MEQVAALLPEDMTKALEHGFNATPDEVEQMKVDSYNALEGKTNASDGHYDCPICRNKGIVAVLRYSETYGRNVETYERCSCAKKRRSLRKLIASGLGSMVMKKTFDLYQANEPWQQIIKERAQQFCDEGGQCFFIGGQSGAGKTHLCTAIAMHLFEQDRELRYMIWPKELPVIQGAVNEPETYTAIMKELSETDVLYIDDLFQNGSEQGRLRPPSGPEIKRAFEIINQRSQNENLVTIISSEFTHEDIVRFQQSLGGRINELAGNGQWVVNLKPDIKKNWRLKNTLNL